MSRTFKQGFTAFYSKRKSAHKCPYPASSAWAWLWWKGWEEADWEYLNDTAW